MPIGVDIHPSYRAPVDLDRIHQPEPCQIEAFRWTIVPYGHADLVNLTLQLQRVEHLQPIQNRAAVSDLTMKLE